ncbi:FAD-dependent oxidoreductase [Singulisphaera sp. Ch08]|uniref:FAD-dependent oxidoreductase n=1 Tax=Singulisphaera sp. Ch08 TaxID=3120278 RepID=A0AAU7CFI1_9BACT
MAEFGDCVVSNFDKYYAVARTFSKVTGQQFQRFFDRIGAPLSPAPSRIRKLFDLRLIEEVFAVQEYAFDADKLAARTAGALEAAGVEVFLEREVALVERHPQGGLRLVCGTPDGLHGVKAGQVFNCTYAGINRLLRASGLPPIPMKHELTEMALVEVPAPLRDLGITVMCGPFFSVMPFPARGLHTLSHVRYTPHVAWNDQADDRDPYETLDQSPRVSQYPYMLRDTLRYLPALSGCVHVDSLWEVKTVLPASEADDSRPILMRAHHGLPDLHCVMGAKIDNIYDALESVDQISRSRRAG